MAESTAATTTAISICIDAKTGKQLWSFRASAEIESTPALANGRVVFGSFDGFSYCLDAVTGKEVWRFRTGPGLRL